MRDGTPCDDGDIGTENDVCTGEVCSGVAVASPPPPSLSGPVCEDDLGWTSHNGYSCIEHRAVQDASGQWQTFCDETATQTACPLSCGICSVCVSVLQCLLVNPLNQFTLGLVRAGGVSPAYMHLE